MAEVTLKMGNRVRPDLLSELPLSIIHLILARVPITDAIRTSFLSRQWRYTWTTLPHLLFKCTNFADEFTEEFGDRMCNFISNVLRFHKGPIHRFETPCSLSINVDLLEKWLLYLSTNDIRELIIPVNLNEGSGANLVRSSIYSCTKLTKLELWNYMLDPPPSTFKGFLFLTSLDLYGVSPIRVETLVSNCPLLESLTIVDYEYRNLRRISVSSPNLKYIFLLCKYTEMCFYAPLMAEMWMKLDADDFTPEDQSSECNYSNFFHGCTNLIKLTGLGYFTRYLSIGIESYHSTLMLRHLKVMKLTDVNFGDIKETLVVARLIIGAPNLHELIVRATKEEDDSGVPYASFSDYLGCAPNFTIMKLRVVTLQSVCSFHSGMQFIKFLLESSSVLETMELEFSNIFRFYEVSAELVGLRRASPNARLVVRY